MREATDQSDWVEEYLELEAAHDLWNPSLRGLRLWPAIRFNALWARYDKHVNPNAYAASGERSLASRLGRYLSFTQIGRYARSLVATLTPAHHDVVFFKSTLTRLRDGDYSVDRLYNSYYPLFENPLIMEDGDIGPDWRPDRKYEHLTYAENLLWQAASVWGRLHNPLTPRESRQIVDFSMWVADLLGIQEHYPRLVWGITSYIRMYEPVRDILMHILTRRVSGRIAFVEDAVYMHHTGLLTKILREAGITVIEPQHGLISRGHFAYNFPQTILRDETHPCREYLPDALMCYGPYWAAQTRVPLTTFVVGYPFLAEMVEHYAIAGQPDAILGPVLVLSPGFAVHGFGELCVCLAQALPNRQIVFKLHPKEFQLQAKFEKQFQKPNLSVVGGKNVYRLLAESAVVIAEGSTTLFEALAFPNKRLFTQRNDFIPGSVAEPFDTPDELIEMIKNPERGKPRFRSDDLWATDWKANFQAMLHNLTSA